MPHLKSLCTINFIPISVEALYTENVFFTTESRTTESILF